MAAKDLLFACLRQEFFGIPCTVDWSTVSAQSAKELYDLAKSQDMAHAVGSALQKADKKSDAFQKQLLLAIARREMQSSTLEEICSLLAEARIPHLPLKGSVLCHLYPQTFLRTSCDIDILVHREDVESAAKLLVEQAGFTRKETTDFHDLSMFSPTGVHFELHFSLQAGPQRTTPVLDEVWSYAHSSEEHPFLYRMENAFLLFYAVNHAANHFYGGGCGIKPFVDLLLLQERTEYDRELFQKLCKQGNLEAFFENALRLARVWFCDETHTELTQEMEAFLLHGGVYGSIENEMAIRQNRAGGKTRYAVSRVWMPKEQLQIRYPDRKVGGIRMPWYQVRRWVETLSGGRLKSVMEDLSLNRATDEKTSKTVADMMTRLGL